MSLPVPKGPVYRDTDEKRRIESRNGVVQFNYVLHLASEWNSESRLTPEILLELQRLAINQIYRCAGHFRDGPVRLEGVKHQPPDHPEVPGLAGEMCEHLSANSDRTATYLASYTMWRVNWIHPFFGGNGRTARASSYLVLCGRLGFVLPGVKTIPELIDESEARRDRYYRALQAADSAWADGRLDISEMESLISDLLAEQLLGIHEEATGRPAEN